VTFIDGGKSYQPGTAAASRIAGFSARKVDITVPLVMDQIQGRSVAERLLAEAWIGRETAACALPPDQIALDAGDVISLVIDGTPRAFRLTRITDFLPVFIKQQRPLSLTQTALEFVWILRNFLRENSVGKYPTQYGKKNGIKPGRHRLTIYQKVAVFFGSLPFPASRILVSVVARRIFNNEIHYLYKLSYPVTSWKSKSRSFC
ncbi:MAG TPA: phage tail protein, partial [Cyclobacteriaceae bacterium]|nr:phage tail protein [Cyclobacteriaceae bacterium]